VVLNLVVNARDAVAGRGRVVISTGTYDLQAEDPRCRAEVVAGRYVVMRVSDTGEGIAPEHLGRIFEPFYTTKESGTGTGLGLATVFGVVRQHGGWVDVQSTVGRGTEVTVAFPVAPKPVSEVSDPIASPADGAGMGAILHVDVDEQVLALAGRTLQRYGYEPIAAQSGESAEELLDTHRNRIRLAIVNRDLTPEMSGAECAERLRRRAPGLTTLMTTDLSRDDVTSGENRNSAAPTTVLCKPFRPMDLVDRVRQILDEPNGSE
jgi:CheY-like chemotaxis protein